MRYRAGFEPVWTMTLEGIGEMTSDNRLLKYTKLTRPIYPLDK
jgi:microcystin degradation protein MlrC